MTANGTMALGWQPRAVFIFADSFGSNAGNVFERAVAFAIPGHSQKYSSSIADSLVINTNGFTTINMVGHGTSSQPNTNQPIRYMAFR